MHSIPICSTEGTEIHYFRILFVRKSQPETGTTGRPRLIRQLPLLSVSHLKSQQINLHLTIKSVMTYEFHSSVITSKSHFGSTIRGGVGPVSVSGVGVGKKGGCRCRCRFEKWGGVGVGVGVGKKSTDTTTLVKWGVVVNWSRAFGQSREACRELHYHEGYGMLPKRQLGDRNSPGTQ